ncbi:Protein of unknown function [Gryllus bimaculatus]|nr:Protein of unknown function [Gryllus bimaculatus]
MEDLFADFVNLKWGEPLVDEEDVTLNLVPVEVFNMTGEDGFCVQICNYGAQIVSVLMSDHEGLVEEVMPSFPNMNRCRKSGYYGARAENQCLSLLCEGKEKRHAYGKVLKLANSLSLERALRGRSGAGARTKHSSGNSGGRSAKRSQIPPPPAPAPAPTPVPGQKEGARRCGAGYGGEEAVRGGSAAGECKRKPRSVEGWMGGVEGRSEEGRCGSVTGGADREWEEPIGEGKGVSGTGGPDWRREGRIGEGKSVLGIGWNDRGGEGPFGEMRGGSGREGQMGDGRGGSGRSEGGRGWVDRDREGRCGHRKGKAERSGTKLGWAERCEVGRGATWRGGVGTGLGGEIGSGLGGAGRKKARRRRASWEVQGVGRGVKGEAQRSVKPAPATTHAPQTLKRPAPSAAARISGLSLPTPATSRSHARICGRVRICRGWLFEPVRIRLSVCNCAS